MRDNLTGFRLAYLILFAGIILIGLGTLLFEKTVINGFYWMLDDRAGLFSAYTVLQTVVFERMIALYRIKANAGFFVYICESSRLYGKRGIAAF